VLPVFRKTSTKIGKSLGKCRVAVLRGEEAVCHHSFLQPSRSVLDFWIGAFHCRNMGMIYEKILRPAFFSLGPERAHELAMLGMTTLGHLAPVCRVMEHFNQLPASSMRPIEAFGLKFPNAVGLAAGFDKNAEGWPAAAALGFGHVEVGTITAHAQPGNPKPRVFRFPSEEAVINRMGFNNDGAEKIAARLANQTRPGKRRIPVGINLGKTKVTPLEEAVQDYLSSFGRLADLADYLVLNVSSPNTPDLRKLQDEDRLRELLGAIMAANHERRDAGRSLKPVLLKIAPDLSFPQIDAVLKAIDEFGLSGIIATNTTLARPGVFANVNQAGGLSGKPLRRRSTEIINYIHRATSGKLPIIGVGGIHDAAGAAEKLDAGATLVQIYTGMIFRGPFFAKDLAHALNARQDRDWWA
jgi:dihydroorotate dehydrogenase